MLKKLQAEVVLKMTEATSSMPQGQVLEVSHLENPIWHSERGDSFR